VHIETGPHKHAIQGTFFLYVWEPAGNRVELANAGARLILATSPSSSALPDPSLAAASPFGRVKGRRSRAKRHP
ncbi:MAG: hypothetical protein ACK4VM_19860, partial [Bosea sp. (in: a-proteobacteria)]